MSINREAFDRAPRRRCRSVDVRRGWRSSSPEMQIYGGADRLFGLPGNSKLGSEAIHAENRQLQQETNSRPGIEEVLNSDQAGSGRETESGVEIAGPEQTLKLILLFHGWEGLCHHPRAALFPGTWDYWRWCSSSAKPDPRQILQVSALRLASKSKQTPN
jgi:hypothetical protein